MNGFTCQSVLRHSRWGLRVAVTAGVLLLFSLAAGAPAWGAGTDGPDRIIFDPAAEPSWIQEYHGTGASADVAVDVVMGAGGVTYVAGATGFLTMACDGTLMKYVHGTPAWAGPKVYNGPNDGVDVFTAIAMGPGDAVYTAGARAGSNGMDDIVVVKWSAAGARQWVRSYDSPSHGSDRASAIVVDSAGNVTVAGETYRLTSQDWVVVSWSPSGSQRWSSRLSAGSGEYLSAMDLVVAEDRNVYATGLSSTAAGVAALTVRYSSSGERKWRKTYTGPAGLGALSLAAAVRPEGGVYVCGATESAATASDGLVMSYTKAGTRDVFALDTGPGGATEQRFNDLDVASTGQVVAVGYTETAGNEDARLVTYTLDGTIAGQITFPGAWDDEFTDVAADAYGGYYMTGSYHTAVNKTAIATARGSVIVGGGGFTSLWAPPLVSEVNKPAAIAVRGTTACVVGQYSTDAAQGVDQLALWYQY